MILEGDNLLESAILGVIYYINIFRPIKKIEMIEVLGGSAG